MYVVNDIELLSRLGKGKILQSILLNFDISISSVRLNEYGYAMRNEIAQYTAIVQVHPDAEFHDWCVKRPIDLSAGDVSSVYVAKIDGRSSLVVSDEDLFLEPYATQKKVTCLSFDDFIMHTLKDERLVRLYNLLKAV